MYCSMPSEVVRDLFLCRGCSRRCSKPHPKPQSLVLRTLVATTIRVLGLKGDPLTPDSQHSNTKDRHSQCSNTKDSFPVSKDCGFG